MLNGATKQELLAVAIFVGFIALFVWAVGLVF